MIRPAAEADIPGILAIWNPVIRDTTITFTPVEKTAVDLARMLADRAAAGFGFLVATDDRGVTGFATYGAFRSGPGYARSCEHSILLHPRAQGRGIGRTLIGAVCDHARSRGAHAMIGAVSGENTAGIAFHTAMGFAETGRLPSVGWKFGRWIDLVLMQKFL